MCKQGIGRVFFFVLKSCCIVSFPVERTYYIGVRLLLHNTVSATLLPSDGVVFCFYSQTCPICLEDFREREYVTVCPCRHGYHRQWVATTAIRVCSHIRQEDKTVKVVNTTVVATLWTSDHKRPLSTLHVWWNWILNIERDFTVYHCKKHTAKRLFPDAIFQVSVTLHTATVCWRGMAIQTKPTHFSQLIHKFCLVERWEEMSLSSGLRN